MLKTYFEYVLVMFAVLYYWLLIMVALQCRPSLRESWECGGRDGRWQGFGSLLTRLDTLHHECFPEPEED